MNEAKRVFRIHLFFFYILVSSVIALLLFAGAIFSHLGKTAGLDDFKSSNPVCLGSQYIHADRLSTGILY
ncbi:MAG: hypothetical protein H6Q14_1326 [Bacteroidetes bacterium]|nr:hypothetical protein [Bacteroidota bacterium]